MRRRRVGGAEVQNIVISDLAIKFRWLLRRTPHPDYTHPHKNCVYKPMLLANVSVFPPRAVALLLKVLSGETLCTFKVQEFKTFLCGCGDIQVMKIN